MDSGNEVQIAMYLALLEKVINAVKEKKSVKDIEFLVNEYEGILTNLSLKSITNDNKIAFIRNYIGEERFIFVKRLTRKR